MHAAGALVGMEDHTHLDPFQPDKVQNQMTLVSLKLSRCLKNHRGSSAPANYPRAFSDSQNNQPQYSSN